MQRMRDWVATEQKFEMCCIESLELSRRGKETTGKQYSSCDETLKFKVTTCLFNRTRALILSRDLREFMHVVRGFPLSPTLELDENIGNGTKSTVAEWIRIRRTHTTIGFRNVEAALDSERASVSRQIYSTA